jgi:hypothetical protein
VSWKTQGLYLWRTRKPNAIVGLPLRWCLAFVVLVAPWAYFAGERFWWLSFVTLLLSGRHNAYVGHTSSRYFRDRQHIRGSYRYGTVGKPWSNLDPKPYSIPCLFPGSLWARRVQEKLWIWMLLPVYNVEWNTKNPRRIKPGRAEQQRWARDANGWRKWTPRAARAGVLLAAVAGFGWQLTEGWR